jgi:hypothetical protein
MPTEETRARVDGARAEVVATTNRRLTGELQPRVADAVGRRVQSLGLARPPAYRGFGRASSSQDADRTISAEKDQIIRGVPKRASQYQPKPGDRRVPLVPVGA